MSTSYCLRARWICPVTTPPIEGGFIQVQDQQIALKPGSGCEGTVLDLGDVAIFPGWVNAHAHLEFSDLEQPLGEPGMALPDWIQLVLAYRQDPHREALMARTDRGLSEAVMTGTTTVGEIATQPWKPQMRQRPPIDVVAFLEQIGRQPPLLPQLHETAAQHFAAAQPADGWHAGISPHAPYTISRALLDQSIALANANNAPLAVHLAESPDEIEWLTGGSGRFAELLAQRQVERADQPDFNSVFEVVQAVRSAQRGLLIHGNYLCEDSIRSIASAPNLSVVYCPRTHDYFRHTCYPLESMLDHGIQVAIGTDGRGSNPDLNLLSEMRCVRRKYPSLAPDTILRLGTLHGAMALGLESQMGSLSQGKWANLSVVRLPEGELHNPIAAILDAETPVVATVYRGQVIYSQHPVFSAQ